MKQEEWNRLILKRDKEIKKMMEEISERSLTEDGDYRVFLTSEGEVIADRYPFDYINSLNVAYVVIRQPDETDQYYDSEDDIVYWDEAYYDSFLDE